MRSLASCSVLLLALIGACGGPTRASTPRTLPSSSAKPGSPLYAFGELGFGMPTGLIGAGAGVMPAQWASFELAAGTSSSGPQAAGMLGVRMPVSDDATLGVASGVSIGRFDDVEPDSDWDLVFEEAPPAYEKEWDFVVWSNTQVEARRAFGASSGIRFSAGLASSIARDEPSCDTEDDQDACSKSEVPSLVPYLSVGYEWQL